MIDLVNVTYEIGGRQILRDINLHIESCETLAVMGMSGAGKSTILRLIAGLIKPTSGKIIIDGQDIAPLKENELTEYRKKISMVFQYAALFDSLNVYENVAFGVKRHMKLSKEEINDIVARQLSTVGMPGTEEYYPAELSGGMKKRVGLARSLAMGPDVILYDEPTAGLDPIMSAAIATLMTKTRDEICATSVLVSHDIPSITRVANRVAMLHRGQIIAIGSIEEMENSDVPEVVQFMNGLADGPIDVRK